LIHALSRDTDFDFTFSAQLTIFDFELLCALASLREADFGSGQGLSVFETTGVVDLRRGSQKSENAAWGRPVVACRLCRA